MVENWSDFSALAAIGFCLGFAMCFLGEYLVYSVNLTRRALVKAMMQ